MSLRVGVVGAGYWGINHVRAFAQAKGSQLAVVCDPDQKMLDRAGRIAPSARLLTSFDEALAAVDAVVLASPATLHANQAIRALSAGKHVLVEKPLALTPADADAVVAEAERAGRVLMVGHLMLYHPGYELVRQLVAGGEIGDVYYLYSIRVNLGRLRRDENALWSFAPHDISMILDLLGRSPISVAARGQAYLQPGVEDVVFVNMTFADRTMAQVQLSWLDPRKERRLTVVGSKKMIEFDDTHATEKIRIYNKGYDRPPTFTQYGEYLTVRHGDIYIPRLDMTEPLAVEVSHFIDCCTTGKPPRTGARQAREVVAVLDAAQTSLQRGGIPIDLTA
jgi:predicted dehydrogenase